MEIGWQWEEGVFIPFVSIGNPICDFYLVVEAFQLTCGNRLGVIAFFRLQYIYTLCCLDRDEQARIAFLPRRQQLSEEPSILFVSAPVFSLEIKSKLVLLLLKFEFFG